MLRFGTEFEELSKDTTAKLVRSSVRPRLRLTTGSSLKVETLTDSSSSSFKVTQNINRFREKSEFSSPPKSSLYRLNDKINTLNETATSLSSAIYNTHAEGNQRGNKKQNKQHDTSSRKIVFARSRGKLKSDRYSEDNNGELNKDETNEVTRLDSQSNIRLRTRRPPGFQYINQEVRKKQKKTEKNQTP